jgi:hypothetical protein
MEFVGNSIMETAPEGVDLKNIVAAPMVTGEKPANTVLFHWPDCSQSDAEKG